MSKQKALFEQIADGLVYQLNAGTSPFQKPFVDGGANFTIPFNETTGNKYKGMNALWLAMQNRTDPRWLTLKQASMNDLVVETGSKSTMINFIKTNEMRPLRGEKGEALRDAEDKLQYETVDLAEPVLYNAWLFNGEQIKNIKDYGEVAAELLEQRGKPASERIADLVELSGVEVSNDPEVNIPFYDQKADKILMPPVEKFESVEKYNAALLHELIHWTGHESRLNREMGAPGSEQYANEELTAGIASLMLGSELNISHELGHHAAYVGPWVQMLQQEPFSLHRAASDAQRIADVLVSLEINRELKLEAAIKPQKHLLNQNDLIVYKNNEYKVQGVMKGNTAQMMEMNTGRRFKLSPQDGLYKALVTTRNAIQEQQAQSQGADVVKSHEQEQDNDIAAETANDIDTEVATDASYHEEQDNNESVAAAVAVEQPRTQTRTRRR